MDKPPGLFEFFFFVFFGLIAFPYPVAKCFRVCYELKLHIFSSSSLIISTFITVYTTIGRLESYYIV